MLRNYLKISLRIMINEKEYSLINVVGLAIGLACTILILLWVQDECTTDDHHIQKDKIYRVVSSIKNKEGKMNVAVTPSGLGPSLVKDFPFINNTARFSETGEQLLITHDKKIVIQGGGLADPEFFEIFTHDFVYGRPEDCLYQPSSIVLTRSIAEKLFGKINPLGMEVKIKDMGIFTIDGVIEDVKHSHLYVNYLIPMSIRAKQGYSMEDFYTYNYTTYILTDGIPKEKLNKLIHRQLIKYNKRSDATISVQPLKDIYLHSNYQYDFTLRGDYSTIYTFLIIAIVVLFVACINFMNLSTARASRRYKEIGVRKMLGATKLQIFIQYYLGSLSLVFITSVIAIGIVEQSIPLFNNLATKQLSFDVFRNFEIFGFVVLVSLIAGVIAGIYPALYLASFKSMKILKGFMVRGDRAALFRKVLVVFQFVISIVLIISTIIVSRQLDYLKNAKVGYDKDHLVYIPLTPTIQKNHSFFKKEIENCINVVGISGMSNLPAYSGPSTNAIALSGKEKDLLMHYYYVDENFLETFNIELIAGKHFQYSWKQKHPTFLVNQAAAKELGMEKKLKKKIKILDHKGPIQGVFADFNYNTLKHPVDPLVLILDPSKIKYLFIRIGDNELTPTIEYIERKWEKIDPDYPMEFRLMNDTLNELYRSEQKMATLYKYFTFIAFFLSGLGLFGLTSYMTERRRKEISIRKVMGATIPRLISLFAKEFLKWVVLANLIAWPVAYWFMNRWLSDFAYKVGITFDIFISSAFVALFLAFVTIGSRVYVASLRNPAVTLRYE